MIYLFVSPHSLNLNLALITLMLGKRITSWSTRIQFSSPQWPLKGKNIFWTTLWSVSRMGDNSKESWHLLISMTRKARRKYWDKSSQKLNWFVITTPNKNMMSLVNLPSLLINSAKHSQSFGMTMSICATTRTFSSPANHPKPWNHTVALYKVLPNSNCTNLPAWDPSTLWQREKLAYSAMSKPVI